MSKTFADFLAMYALASQVGCQLNPQLKEAMLADARWPTKQAGPIQDINSLPGELPDNVALFDRAVISQKRSA